MPVALYGQTNFSCDAAEINRSHTFKDFGGITLSGTLATALPFEELSYGRTSVRLDIGLGIAFPPRMFPAQAELFVRDQVSLNFEQNSPAAGARYRQLFGVDWGLFVEGAAAAAYYHQQAAFAWDGVIGYMGRGPRQQFGVSLGAGHDPITGYHGLVSITYARAH